MTKDARFALRRVIEKHTKSTRFALICNHVNKIIRALQSRCARFRFALLDAAHIQERLQYVVTAEGLDVDESGFAALVLCTSVLEIQCPRIMEKILERYERYSYTERALFSNEDDPQADWRLEYNKMKARVESLQKSQRHLMGEQLDSLSIKELQHLEQQLESSLKHIRSRKTQLLVDSISELQKKEKLLLEQNKTLQIMAKTKAKALVQNVPWEQQNKSQYSSAPPRAVISDSAPTPTSRAFQARANEEESPQPQLRLGNTLLPPWMLSHINGYKEL